MSQLMSIPNVGSNVGGGGTSSGLQSHTSGHHFHAMNNKRPISSYCTSMTKSTRNTSPYTSSLRTNNLYNPTSSYYSNSSRCLPHSSNNLSMNSNVSGCGYLPSSSLISARQPAQSRKVHKQNSTSGGQSKPIWCYVSSPSELARKYASIAPIWCHITKPRQLKEKFATQFSNSSRRESVSSDDDQPCEHRTAFNRRSEHSPCIMTSTASLSGKTYDRTRQNTLKDDSRRARIDHLKDLVFSGEQQHIVDATTKSVDQMQTTIDRHPNVLQEKSTVDFSCGKTSARKIQADIYPPSSTCSNTTLPFYQPPHNHHYQSHVQFPPQQSTQLQNCQSVAASRRRVRKYLLSKGGGHSGPVVIPSTIQSAPVARKAAKHFADSAAISPDASTNSSLTSSGLGMSIASGLETLVYIGSTG
ncbi:hypothetical protein GJ496_002620 [Pomphorhynchus laevis]|nr:hypothetical protein GJ496_002620 [Pomphorhynchus laevis]